MRAHISDMGDHETCDQCGFDGADYDDALLLDELRALGSRWRALLTCAGGAVGERPAPRVWSPLEYAAHSRDVAALHVFGVQEALAEGRPALLEIDLQGARQVHAAMPDALMVFLAPPSWDELVRRLTGRRTEPPDVVARRLAMAREELAAEPEYDHTLVNTSVQDVVEGLLALMEVGDPLER